MPAGRKIFEHIDEFNKIVLDLANIEVKFEDEDLALLLLTSLPTSYKQFMDILLYGREALTLKDVMATLNSKEIKERSKTKEDDAEGLYVRGRSNRRDSRQSRGKSRSKSRSGRLKHYIFQSEDHLKRICQKNNRKKSTGYIKKHEQPSSSGSTYDDSEVMMVMSIQAQALLDWIIDSGCLYHMTPSEAGLQALEKQELFGKKSLGKLDFCENYVLGKSHRVSLGVRRHTTQGVIDYVHSDLWGPSQVESLGGKRYFLSIVDNYSRRVWVYILKFKHEAFGKFKVWKQLVENQTERTVKKLRTDNGLEFCNHKFDQLCIESRIARHLSVAGTPQQNGVADCMNITFMDKERCLLLQSGLPKTFWAEATCTVTYIINKSPSRAIEKKIPMEIWSGHPIHYGMLRIFGYVTYPHDKQDQEDEDAGDQATDQPLDLTDYQLVRDREPRTRRKPLRFRDESNMAAYVFVVAEEEDTHEPLTYQEVVAYEDSSKWKASIKEEMDSLMKNKPWELVDHPAGQKLMSCKWLFKIKEGIEVRHISIRVILALTACKDYELEQLDVKTTFLHGKLEEVIYIKQPPGYEQGNKVCLLKKSLYGLKQSHRQWYKRFDEYMLNNGFKRSSYDICIYYRSYAPGEYIYLLLYVDDMMIACKSKDEIGSTKSLLKKEFNMKELEEAKKILGMEIVRDRSRKILRVSQFGYVYKILNNFRIDNGKSVKVPLGGHFKLSLKDFLVRDYDVERMSKVSFANAVRSLMYLMVCMRPDIVYVVSVVSRYLANPGFADSDYGKDPDKGRSITGYAFLVHGCVVSWKAMLQHVVALSTIEVDYMALTEAVKEAIWLRGLLEELSVELNTVAVNCDNQGAIHLSRNHLSHERTKHINVRYHFIKEVLEAKTVKVLKVGIDSKGFLKFFDCSGSRQGVEDLREFDIENFDGTGDFGLWRIKMRALLIQHGCEAALEVLPADMEAQTKVELNKKAHSDVILCLGNKVLREVTGETTTAGVWSKLETLYMTKSLANKLYLKKKLYTFYMPAGRTITERIDEFNKIVLDLANIEVKFEDEDLALLLLTSLPASYEHFVDILLYGREALTLKDVMVTLNTKEIKERSNAKEDDGEGLYVRGRTDRKDSRQSRRKSRSKSQSGRPKCYIFQSKDHLKRNCPKNNRKKSTGYVKKHKQPSSSGSTYDDSEVMMVMSAHAQVLLDWIIDSGCSYHMTPRLDIFFDFLECDGGSVQLGDNRKCKIRCIGKVRVQLKDGSSFVLHNVRYIPELKRNLTPLGTLETEGYTVKLQSGKVKVINGEINGSVKEKDGLTQFQCRKARYSGSDRLCSFTLMGSVLGGIIGRFKHKEFRKFKEWKQLVENETERTVKKPRTNNGLEFCNREFEQLCIEIEIARHLTVAGMPQQNGVAERMNRTLMDKVRCLLIQSGLPKTFWAEATCMAAYLINRSPSRAIEKKTPMEMWSGHPSDYGMLKIFGCVAYPHDKQCKLEPRAVKYVLLGYLEGLKWYRLYRLDDESPKIITSRNVVFNESVMYKDTLKDSDASDNSVEELQVEVELHRLNNHALEKDQTDQKDGYDEDAGDQATDQPPDLTDYQLVRDREPRTRTKPLRFRDESNMAAYVFVVAEEADTHEPLTYQEPVAYEECSKWKVAMKEEMGSLRKNKTWELVDHPAGQKLVSCKWLFKIKEGIEGVQRPSKAKIGSTKSFLKKEFNMKELEEAKKILGMEITMRNRFKMPLGGHFKLSLKDCPVRDCDIERKSKVSHANAVGSLMYLMVCTRPDIAYAVSVVSRYLANSSKNHWEAVKWILKYLRGTANVGLVYETNRGNYVDVTCFVDSDYAKDPNKGRSITGYAFLVHGCVVSWKEMLQHVVALSTTEVEYMAFTEAVKEAIWLRGLLEELGVQLNTVAVNCDNQGAIHLSQNLVFHERTKHINVCYHFIREVLEAKTVKVLKVGTESNAADALTKVVPGLKLQHCLELLNVGVG
uniref:Retrovirus-related Pol polyprotein from transposon TNT 1-94 n=1 Tax=Tanacetum cinerariifolium TaxID=118510 RepID=A0A6L2PC32_TANCI|nr:retrovirus-related Pol polyprotein from transposon TNT 1-94 [Tanacetum cinerariifolium]